MCHNVLRGWWFLLDGGGGGVVFEFCVFCD